jgi:tRNA threonylcarbamoyladenosine biosynthesis protein TsaE
LTADAYSRETRSPEETHALGEALGAVLVGGLTIGLVGQLGAGKTVLVKGIAAGNALVDTRAVTSPTFTLVHEYPGRLTLFHLDAYRLKGSDDLLALGVEEFARADSAVVVEWADRVAEAMPADTLWIELVVTGGTDRRFSFQANGDLARRCLDALRQR